ncbi:patatin-like phospholipase family protein [Kordia sp. YSTF-M3]|uniref:Patatin-like phospholipase family protein n=1 Tax=Kordia aestuariivivens TaxID=2759037 RepID=A0ABR7Q9D7_9FLAO|nr:patatin-like phospholipase family protein [Kordia aestuariivivens]MBC8755187.1 patatin-like phospholipase family protein [Kordia aestuariivivens]
MNKWILICITLLSFSFATAQEEPKTGQDLKVGLVLSGGGAKGLAHIGTLKIIDSLGIRVDYIGGTSMGAIIGSLYASGYSGKQIDSIFKKTDLEILIQDELPRSAKTFYEKEDSERYAISLPFDSFKVTFPTSISKGQNVYNLLAQLLLHVDHIDDFSKLPIPFLCIASDIEKGEQVILDKGYLPDAITASGAFPSLFEPVEIGKRLLIDGGVTNNYPIDEIKAKNVDIIIGVDVQDDLADRDKLKSAMGILSQINNFRTINDMKKKKKQTDVYIRPDIIGFSVISFDKGKELIKRGEVAGKNQLEALKAVAAQQYQKSNLKPVKTKDSLAINYIHLRGNDKYTRSYVRGKLRFKTPTKISFRKFTEGIGNLAATGNFTGIRYKTWKNEDGTEDIILNLKEAPNTTFLRLAAHYDDVYKTAGLINVTKKKILFNNDVASLDFIIGDNIRYNFEYYIDKGYYWSLGLKSRFNAFERGINYDLIREDNSNPAINRIDVKVSDFTNQLYAQTVVREEFVFGIGAEHKRLKITSETIVPSNENETIFEKSDFVSSFGFLRLDTYNNKYFPSKGIFFSGNFNWYLYSSDYNKNFEPFSIASAKIGYATPLFSNISLNLSSEGGFNLGDSSVSSLDFVLGGFGNNFINNYISFLGYDFLSFAGDSFVKGSITLDYNFSTKHHFNFTANYANAGENIFDSGEWFTKPDFNGYAIGYGMETFFGPLQVKYAWTPDVEKDQLYFSIGFWF